jgi:hypothetical protein
MSKHCLSLGTLGALVLISGSSFAQGEVKLIRSENYDVCGYNNGCYEERNALIQVQNLAYQKEVYVHQELANGTWIDIPASFIRQGNSTYDLWGVDRTKFASYGPYGDEFVLKYVVNGQTYWDNNNGANYRLITSSMNAVGPMLGNDVNVLVRSASCTSGQLYAYVDVRNIAYTKAVALTYTTDNWVTTTTVNASFMSSYQTGYSTFITFPDAYNVERWRALASVTCSTSLQYYVSYTVNGTTYYDNNYAANYHL